MNLNDYQTEALKTDKVPGGADSMIVPLLGMAGEIGTLLAEYKKRLRDGDAHSLFKNQVAEELGDILWYVSNVASKLGMSLDDLARANLAKIQERWPTGAKVGSKDFFDEGFPALEQFPRKFVVEFKEEIDGERRVLTQFLDGKKIGDSLTDNAYVNDGYRFHDVFHLSHVAVLGWSPVFRKLTKRKRKSDARIDEVEDGGRSAVLEEGVVAFYYAYAERHSFLKDIHTLDFQLLRTIKAMVSRIEVQARSYDDWQKAILQGFAVWREVCRNNGGHVEVDMVERHIRFVP